MKTKFLNTHFFWISLLVLLSLASCGDSAQYSADSSSGDTSSANILKHDQLSKRDPEPKYVAGEILVKFKSGTPVSKMDWLHISTNAERIKELKRIGVQHLKLYKDMTVEDAVRLYNADPDVEYAEPNYILHALATTPTDPNFSNLWGLNNTGQSGGTPDADIDAPEAWDITTGLSSVIIAVIDTGVAYNHGDLSSNIWTNPGETGCADGDDDGNGYPDDCYGWDFIDKDNDPMDYNGHGTHVAGTIAAEANNGLGITGVMWNAQIMPIRFLGVSGAGDTADAISAITYASDNGARIINASWGGGGFSQSLYDIIDYARSQNVLFVAAAGNSAINNDIYLSYPASYNLPNIISVAATDQNDALAYFSNYGATSVDLGAPGVSIYSSIPVFSYGPTVSEYSENFDGASGDLPSPPATLLGWARGGNNSTWAVTAGTGVVGTEFNSLEDSPPGSNGGNYVSNTDSWARCMTQITSAKDSRYKLSFQWKGYIDPSTYDYLNINYSTDGTTWYLADWRDGDKSGGFVSDSTDFTIAADLSDNNFYFGFGLQTDGTGNDYDGVYIDDVLLTRELINITGDSYVSYDGTSMAAPHVSGVAGLILSNNPALSYSELKDIILRNVDLKPSLCGLTVAGGRVNALNALQNSILLPAPCGLLGSSISSSQIDLRWIDNSDNETGFKIERKTGSEGYSRLATVGAGITLYSDTGLSAATTYYYRVMAYNDTGDSAYSNEANTTTRSRGGGGGGCFIATAAYGSYLAPEVNVLKKFRDKWLIADFGFRIAEYEFKIPNDMGRAFVDLYYRTSPPIADYISRHEGLRALTRIALTPIVYGIKYPSALFILAGLSVMAAFLRREKMGEKIEVEKMRS